MEATVEDVSCPAYFPFIAASVCIFRRGYTEQEIEAMFARYDLDGDRVLDENEQQFADGDLNQKRVWVLGDTWFCMDGAPLTVGPTGQCDRRRHSWIGYPC